MSLRGKTIYDAARIIADSILELAKAQNKIADELKIKNDLKGISYIEDKKDFLSKIRGNK